MDIRTLANRIIAKSLDAIRDIYSKRHIYYTSVKSLCSKLFLFVNNNRNLSSILLWGVVLGVLCIMIASKKQEQQVTHVSAVQKKKAINMLITNQMSELEQTKSFDKEITAFMKKWDLKGASFALMKDDKLIYAKGYGYADKEEQVKCEVKNVFRIASASKLITATAIMRLIEQKKLSLDSKVFGPEGIISDSTILDIKDRNIKLITVEHLLKHTSGLNPPIDDPAFANYTVARTLNKKLPLEVDDMVKYATMFKLRARPGGHYEYSNLGYIILGKVIEVASGMSYEAYVQKELLEPAGCHYMYIGRNFNHERDPNEVKYYEVKEAELVDAYDGSGKRTLKSDGGNNVTLLSSAGGWVASPSELLRFVASINLCDTKANILTEESIKAMTYDSRRYKPMGWATVHGSEWIRSGSMAGTCTLIKQQKNGYSWVFITNSSAWIGYKLTNHISYQITRSISKVKEWPSRDLFNIKKGDQVALEDLE